LKDGPGGAVPGDNDWVTRTLDSELDITGSTVYWPSVAFDNDTPCKYDAVGGFRREHKSITYSSGTMDDPFPASTTSSTTRKYSIYITYTATDGADISYVRRIKEGEGK
jgi:hypothetical protein